MINFDPEVVKRCKQLDRDGIALQQKGFKYLITGMGIYGLALVLTIADIIPAWAMYLILAGTLIDIWYVNAITKRGRQMQYKSFRLIDAEIMRLFREYREAKK